MVATLRVWILNNGGQTVATLLVKDLSESSQTSSTFLVNRFNNYKKTTPSTSILQNPSYMLINKTRKRFRLYCDSISKSSSDRT